jgi:hypothetical protein
VTGCRTRIAALAALAALGLGLAACGGGSSSGTTSTPPPAAVSSAAPAVAPGLSCADVSTDLQTVLSDQKSSDAAEQEAWVTGGHSADLQQLISDTNGVTGSTQLDQDAATFNTDASGYLADQSPSLNTGWETEYHQVRLDINALATDCGLTPVPAPPGTS